MAGLKPVTEGSLQTHKPLRHRGPFICSVLPNSDPGRFRSFCKVTSPELNARLICRVVPNADPLFCKVTSPEFEAHFICRVFKVEAE
ncbi:Bv80/bb-1 [Plakobranchus ocellatus]|uniref:Bv80/bb-1 n=1 Tax=Plakobranchus ocellatus TaxID=259542 RepID=A0AAV4DIR6_9GAST|nr:Bv80/bb-1 [Plakobranchus ocellatus]